MTKMTQAEDRQQRRLKLMRVCAAASAEELAAALDALAPLPPIEDVRPAEIGLVMVRGRIGGDGAPFNLGEATMTRAAIRIGTVIGHGHLLGRRPEQARQAAIIDALTQIGTDDARIDHSLIEPVTQRVAAQAARHAAEVAATRVEFFTLVRGHA